MTGLLRAVLLWLSRRAGVGNAIESIGIFDGVIRRFVAGRTHKEAVETARGLVEDGYRVTLSLLGEDVEDEVAAAAASAEYRELLESIARAGIAKETRIALKPTLLGLGLGFETAQGHLLSVLEAARWVGVRVELDMERSSTVDDTLRLFRLGAEESPDLGLAIQAYLRRSEADVRELIGEGNGRVRLVKGAYQEPESAAFQRADEITQSFHAIARELLEPASIEAGSTLAVATHDLQLIAGTRTRAHRKRVPEERWEVQMLLGVQPSRRVQLHEQGYAVRVYLPYGQHWYPYFMRRLAERPANLWFALRSLVSR